MGNPVAKYWLEIAIGGIGIFISVFLFNAAIEAAIILVPILVGFAVVHALKDR